MAGGDAFINNGYSMRGRGLVKFASDPEAMKASDVEKYQASPEYLADLEKRLKKKYRFEQPQKPPVVAGTGFTLPERKKPAERPADEVEHARFRYIECIAGGLQRTQALQLLTEELNMTFHEFYKLLRKWGFRDRELEKQAVQEFIRSIG